MRKLKWILFYYLIPVISFATQQGSGGLDFRPPETDASIKLLSHIFGLVDGVLFGTGSQIVGEMFGIFNAAVLALGAIVITYTTMISIINTANEGTALGKKFSTVWLPLRSVIAVSLLIPKASGYCAIQIFVMWTVVQGVGAADAIWNTALEYLQRGGVLVSKTTAAIQTADVDLVSSDGSVDPFGSIDLNGYGTVPSSPIKIPFTDSSLSFTAQSAYIDDDKEEQAAEVLRSLVCVYSIEKLLRNKAAASAGAPSVPAFMNNFYIDAESGTTTFYFPPKIPNNAYANAFYGICGSIRVNPVPALKVAKGLCEAGVPGLITGGSCTGGLTSGAMNHPLLTVARKARAIAAQQMVMELDPVARSIVENLQYDSEDKEFKYSPLGYYVDKQWVGSEDFSKSPLLNGFEFVYAVNSFYAIMRPTLRLLSGEMEKADFIEGAKKSGWILAGSYFYQLVTHSDRMAAVDASSPGSIKATFEFKVSELDQGTRKVIYNDSSGNEKTISLKLSDLTTNTPLGKCDYWKKSPKCGTTSSDDQIEKYIAAALGSKETTEAARGIQKSAVNFGLDHVKYLGMKDDCSWGDIPCDIAEFLENAGRGFGNLIIGMINYVIITPAEKVLITPLVKVAPVFSMAMSGSLQPGKNPIVEIAKLGSFCIDIAGKILIGVLFFGVIAALIPFLFPIIPLLIILWPIIAFFVGLLFFFGITLAYYVPLIPYIIFLFSALAWFISVIEAMVAAPIVALGLAHPDGHDTLGKTEQGIMLLASVFLRPALMILGFIIAIILSYVVVILLNAGFYWVSESVQELSKPGGATGDFTGFSALIAPFFMMGAYTTIYVSLMQECFNLIYMLPDRVLAWIGAPDSGIGGEVAGSAAATVKGSVEKTGKEMQQAGGAIKQSGLQAASYASKAATKGKGDATQGAKATGK